MLKGLLTRCEDHNRPLRECLSTIDGGPYPKHLHATDVQPKLRRILGDNDGCTGRRPDNNICHRVPAPYWRHCPCGCGLSKRACGKHRNDRVYCPNTNPPPPPGTGTVPWQQVGRSKTSG